MPMLDNQQEQDQRQSSFLSLESQNTVEILSNLYYVKSHFINDRKFSVIHDETDCKICKITEVDKNGEEKLKYPVRPERYYFVRLNDNEGILRIPNTSFFFMQTMEQETGKDKRSQKWKIKKEGSGLQTKYFTMPLGDTKPEPEEKRLERNEELQKALDAYSERLVKNYDSFYVNTDSEAGTITDTDEVLNDFSKYDPEGTPPPHLD